MHVAGPGSKRGALGIAALFVLSGIAAQASAAPVFNSVNGHYYDAIAVAGGINWNIAKTAAEGLSLSGAQGHLVTITSAAEQSFIVANLPLSLGSASQFGYWIGASNPSGANSNAGYTWVTGETFSYTNWNVGEPNGHDGAPSAIHFFGLGSTPGAWNDANAANWNFPGYIVEFEPVSVPEPASLALFGIGLLGFGFSMRKKA